MNKKELYNLLMLGMRLNSSENCYYEKCCLDEKVNKCLLMLYFSLMINDKGQSDQFYGNFEEMYNKLSEEQKEMAKIEIATVLDIEYEPKTKKKERGEMKYGKNYRYRFRDNK